MIQRRYPGEWTCTQCDAHHNGYVPTQTWWRGKAPEVCWRCVIRNWSQPACTTSAAYAIAQAVSQAGWPQVSVHDLVKRFESQDVGVVGVSHGRLAAMVLRLLRGIE